MTDVGRMSVQELVGKVLADEHADVLRQAVVWLAQELMEAEVSQRAGAGYGERNPDRMARRNGYRERSWDTRVGSIELAIPKLRSGSYFPSFLEPRRRSEQALVAVVQEAYVNGVSTRKVDRLVEALGLAGVSKDTVSRLCRGLDEQVQAFRERPWTAPTRTCGWTPRWRRSGPAVGSSTAPWWSPTGSTRPASAR
jgi:putative transposase